MKGIYIFQWSSVVCAGSASFCSLLRLSNTCRYVSVPSDKPGCLSCASPDSALTLGSCTVLMTHAVIKILLRELLCLQLTQPHYPTKWIITESRICSGNDAFKDTIIPNSACALICTSPWCDTGHSCQGAMWNPRDHVLSVISHGWLIALSNL